MKNKNDNDDKGFKITDRRLSYDDEPEAPKADAGKKEAESKRVEPPPAQAKSVEPPPPQAEPHDHDQCDDPSHDHGDAHQHHHAGPMPPIDFRQFVLSLATSALIQMGDAKAPDGENYIDMEAARQTIDIIEMLKIKTKGNLDKNEASIIDEILSELRMRFVMKTKTVK